MTPELQAELVDELIREYPSTEQLDQVVKALLKQPLQVITTANGLRAKAEDLIEDLIRQGGPFYKFLFKLSGLAQTPQLKSVINEILDLDDGGDAFAALVMLNEPFVDRKLFRDKLRSIFDQNQNHAILIARGKRSTGRTHSQWLINHVARKSSATFIYVNLLGKSIDDVVALLIPRLGIPSDLLRDAMALATTKAKGFLPALSAHLETPGSKPLRCIVFDHLDRDEVPSDLREFVDTLLIEAAMQRLPGIKIVVLGHSSALPADVVNRHLDEDISPLLQTDVQRFFLDLSKEKGTPLGEQAALDKSKEVFAGLTMPLDAEGMKQMAARLKEKILEFA